MFAHDHLLCNGKVQLRQLLLAVDALFRLGRDADHLRRGLLLPFDHVLHEREGQNLLDALNFKVRSQQCLTYTSCRNGTYVMIAYEHHHSVNTHSPATCGWKTVFESLAECLVDELCLVVSLRLLVCLLLLFLR